MRGKNGPVFLTLCIMYIVLYGQFSVAFKQMGYACDVRIGLD